MKKLILVLAVISLLASMLMGCGSSGKYTGITLNEAAHSVFYAPVYVAIEKGYFNEEGLKVKLVNGSGTDKTKKALLSGDCEIGLMGPEAAIYVYNEGTEDYLVNFAQLAQRSGDFLVSKDKNEEFSWQNVIGKTVIGGRADGMPEMVFEYILKKNGIDPKTDLTIVQNIQFGSTSKAFASGQGDYTIEFEPEATALESDDIGKVITSLGEESGKVPYTAFLAKKSYIGKNPEIIQSFTDAVQKGMDYVSSHTPEEVAKVIQPKFSEIDRNTLGKILYGYYEQDTWKCNLIFEEDSFNLLQDILNEAGELKARVPYEDLITSEFVSKAAKQSD